MNRKILLNAIGNIDDELIIDAKQYKYKKGIHIKAIAVAACVAIILGVLIVNLSKNTKNLPMLMVTNESGSMGFEGFMAYDISEIINANPWTENSRILSLPVFKNLYTYDETGNIPNSLNNYTDKFLEDIKNRFKGFNNVTFKSYGGFDICVEFDPPIELNKKYNFNYYAPLNDIKSVGDFLRNEYKQVIDMKKPILNIYHGDYDIYGRQLYNISFYEGKGDLIEKIINYNFNKINFSCDDNGKLSLIRFDITDLSEKIGDYPIIETTKAKKLLLNGNYITTVPYTLTGNEKISKLELIYRNGGTEKFYMPYYRFYIELPNFNKTETGLKTYGAYYVPAVEERFISNMPVWDGSFN